MPRPARDYEGPECPRCRSRLTADWLRSGTVTCPDCMKPFEATAFRPPERHAEVVAMAAAAATVDGVTACANHARNAAVANCQRCGIFICGLCNMDVGTGPYCPSCFDRLRSDAALAPAVTRYRDYAAMARVAMIAGLFFSFLFLGFLFGGVSLFYARKGFPQLREDGRSRVGLVIVCMFAVLEIIGSLSLIALLIIGLAARGK